MPADWWTVLDDPGLNELIGEAFERNLRLEAAWERLRAARSLTRREASAFFPDLEGFLQAEASSGDDRQSDGDQFGGGLLASYELDLWGRIRSSVAAERFRADAVESDFQSTALALSGDVALAWYRLVESENSIRLLEAQVAANEKLLESLKSRFRGGQVRGVDILRQQQLLEATRERLIVVTSERALLRHQLALLLGRIPQRAPDARDEDLPALPPLPATGLPAELVLRRPDLQSAYRVLQAADRDLATAVSNRFPRLNLTAGLTSRSEDASDLFDDWARSIGAELIGPIVDGGERRAEVERTRAIMRQRLAEFGQASLEAFREVEDALAREGRQRERLSSLRRQVDLQRAAYEQLQSEFFNGVAGFIDLLTALTETQQLQRDLIVEERLLVESRIALYRALAGPVPLPEEPFQP